MWKHEDGTRVQVIAESRVSELEDQLRRAKSQLEDHARQLQDVNAVKARLAQENMELHRHLQDLDTGNAMLSNAKTALQQQLEDTKTKLDDEMRVLTTEPIFLQTVHILLCRRSSLQSS